LRSFIIKLFGLKPLNLKLFNSLFFFSRPFKVCSNAFVNIIRNTLTKAKNVRRLNGQVSARVNRRKAAKGHGQG
jgi:hypothetical protein